MRTHERVESKQQHHGMSASNSRSNLKPNIHGKRAPKKPTGLSLSLSLERTNERTNEPAYALFLSLMLLSPRFWLRSTP